ncbi:MAG: hypothetical protein ACFFD4_26620 [Candidatus Odinarchaeota archaeon]
MLEIFPASRLGSEIFDGNFNVVVTVQAFQSGILEIIYKEKKK